MSTQPTDAMQKSMSTVIHRTRRGASVIQKKVDIQRNVSEREVEQLAQSGAMSPMSPSGGPPGASNSRNSKIFDNMDGLDGTVVVCEEGTSSDEEEEPKQKSKSGKLTKVPNPDAGNSMEAEIQAEISQCTQGQKSSCNLSRGQMIVVPPQVATCVTITELSLCDNALISVDGALIAPLQNLVKISISNNPDLTELPLQLFQLSRLETFLVDRCKVSALPIDTPQGEAWMVLPNLVTFGAEWNHLKMFPFALMRGCPRLAELFLAENSEIQELPDAASIVQRAQAGGAKIKCKLDNRPKLMQQVANLEQDPNGPLQFFTVDWNKIYPDKVLDFLYLGSLRTAQCPEVYQDLDIGFILTAGRHLKVNIGQGMEQLVLGIDDLPGEDMKPFFKEAFDFIERARASKRGILIHCFAGMSRSVTFTAAYLMHIMYPMTRDEALVLIRTSRPAAKPNEGFMQGLLQWEDMLKRERS